MQLLAFPWQSVAAGLGTGLLTTLLFCLPPLLDVRGVRPVLVLRRLVESRAGGLWRLAGSLVGAPAATRFCRAGGGGAGRHRLGAFRLGQSGRVVCADLHRSRLVVLLLLAAVALRTLRFLLDRVRLRLPSFLRHGLANLYRPGNQSAAVMAALGTGVMLILAVYLMQAALLRDLRETASPKLPNLFLIDVTTDEVAGVKEFFRAPAGREPSCWT